MKKYNYLILWRMVGFCINTDQRPKNYFFYRFSKYIGIENRDVKLEIRFRLDPELRFRSWPELGYFWFWCWYHNPDFKQGGRSRNKLYSAGSETGSRRFFANGTRKTVINEKKIWRFSVKIPNLFPHSCSSFKLRCLRKKENKLGAKSQKSHKSWLT